MIVNKELAIGLATHSQYDTFLTNKHDFGDLLDKWTNTFKHIVESRTINASMPSILAGEHQQKGSVRKGYSMPNDCLLCYPVIA